MIRYEIILPNERLRSYRLVTLFIMLAHMVMFGLLYSKAPAEGVSGSLCVIGLVVSISSLLFILIQRTAHKFLTYRPEIAFFILSIIWFILGAYWQGAVVMLLAVIGIITWKKPVVVVNSDGVSYPSFPAKKWTWPELANIMARDGMLTIDCKDNRLIQSVIEKSSAQSLDETMFNDFCQRQLTPKGI